MENKFAVISEMEMYEINGGVYPKDAGTSGLVVNPFSVITDSAKNTQSLWNDIAQGLYYKGEDDSHVSSSSQKKEQRAEKAEKKESSGTSKK